MNDSANYIRQLINILELRPDCTWNEILDRLNQLVDAEKYGYL